MRKFVNFAAAVAIVAVAAVLTVSCNENMGLSDGGQYNVSPGSSSGTGGSMARFTITGNYMYTVDHTALHIVSLADPSRPVEVESLSIGWDIETIFTMDDLLFIGSQSAMLIYDISRPEFPKELSRTNHFRSCDPVVAYDTLAFVTLNSSLGQWCGNRGNQLQVYNIADLKNPVMLNSMTLSSPRGLAVDGRQKIVFVCDNGLKAFDITDPENIQGLYTAGSVPEVGRIDAYDCILWQGRLIVIGSDGLYQLGYDRDKFTFISKIDLRRDQ